MVITVDKNKCIKCGICISRMKGYCISTEEGFPIFNELLCNTCQKCVAICPSRAIMVNGCYPEKISNNIVCDGDQVYALLEKRRSIKKFKDKQIPEDVLEKIVSVSKFAPNQNKNISLHVITDKILIAEIDRVVIKFVKKMYKLLFRFKAVELLISLFYKDLPIIKAKMEHGNFNHGIYQNTQAIIIATGKKNIPVTESSAHYVLAAIMFMAESSGVGSCLMDSIYIALRTDKKARKLLTIDEDVLGVLTLAYSDEGIINIPRGYELNTIYN